MKIESSKSVGYNVAFVFLGLLIFLLILLYEGCSVGGAVVLVSIPLFINIRFWIALRRTIIMSESGCTIKFLWYTKTYKWSQLKIKRIENYSKSYGYKDYYTSGALFSPSKIHKPRWLKPATYCGLIHPLSVVFVYFKFTPTEQLAKILKYDRVPDIYTVEESLFREKMEEWNVILD